MNSFQNHLNILYSLINKKKLNKRFLASRQKYNRKALTYAYSLASFLVISGVVLDYIKYKEHLILFFKIRIAATIIILLYFLLFKQKSTRQYTEFFILPMATIIIFYINLMIYIANDPTSIYYAGITLTTIGVSIFFCSELLIIISLHIYSIVLLYFWNISNAASNPQILSNFNTQIILMCFLAIVAIFASYLWSILLLKESNTRGKLRLVNFNLKNTLKKLRKTREELIQSEKLAALGRISANLAHEINNNINYLNTSVFLLERKIKNHQPNDQKIEKYFQNIREASSTTTEIIKELDDFTNQKIDTCEKIFLEDLINSAIRFTKSYCSKYNINIEKKLKYKIFINANKIKMLQVLINLIRNAAYVLEGVKNPKIIISAELEKENVKITIIDNGKGIPKNIRAKIFEPFFSTKQKGAGMGLGLSICSQIIQMHKGNITFTSKEDIGTTFHLLLPKIKTSEQPSF